MEPIRGWTFAPSSNSSISLIDDSEDQKVLYDGVKYAVEEGAVGVRIQYRCREFEKSLHGESADGSEQARGGDGGTA